MQGGLRAAATPWSASPTRLPTHAAHKPRAWHDANSAAGPAAHPQDGCTPNVVTYNTLIDVYGKTGLWSEAVKVLDRMRAHVGGSCCCSSC